MSDAKNDTETDFEEKLAKIAGKKSRKRSNHNIYERFIKRVQGESHDNSNSNSNNKDEAFRSLDDYESLNTHTFELYTNPDERDDKEAFETKTIANAAFDSFDQDALTFDFYDDTDSSTQAVDASFTNPSSTVHIAHTTDKHNTSQPMTQDRFIPAVVPSQGKLASSKKPLIIGMIFGSLLIVMVVLALIFTGVLSTPMQVAAPDSTEVDLASESDKAVPDNAPAVAVNTTPAASNAPSNPIEQPAAKTQDTAVSENPESIDTSKIETLPAESSDNAATETKNNDLGADAAITYEDFRQESQNTLYREMDD